MAAPSIFVSHSHQDDTFGLRLIDDLRARLGRDAVWYDASGGLHGGDEWWRTIVAEITVRDTFIVLLSPDALTSEWVLREMSIAYWQHVKLGKKLLPLLCRPCEPAADWQIIQAIDFTDEGAYAQHLAELLSSLDVSEYQTPPTLLPNELQTPQQIMAKRLTKEIHTAFGREDWMEVVRRTDFLLDDVPEAMTVLLWRERSAAYLALNRPLEALPALEQALKSDPYDVSTLQAQAQAMLATNRVDDALKVLARASAIVPLDDVPAQLALRDERYVALMRAKRQDEAQAVVIEALHLAPDDQVWQSRQHEQRVVLAAPTEYEYCEIVWEGDGFNSVFIPVAFSARAITRDGNPLDAVYLQSDKGSRGVPTDWEKGVVAAFVQKLETKGWEKLTDTGEKWYSYRFRRPLSS